MSSQLFYTYLFCVLMVSLAIWGCVSMNWPKHLLDNINKKYPRSVVIQYMFSFGSGWETMVDTEDIPIIRKFRKADLLYYVVVILILGLLMLTGEKTMGPGGEILYFKLP